ncbi:MAG TPA: hypothetical protein VMI72_07085 [Roseiarcus sp.]|nr:hypothetical protein [Roseiarcus sp.]
MADNTSKLLPDFGEVASGIGVCSTLLLCMSVVYSTAYFWMIGTEFQNFMSAQDYVVDSIHWIPTTFLVFIISFVFGKFGYDVGFDHGHKKATGTALTSMDRLDKFILFYFPLIAAVCLFVFIVVVVEIAELPAFLILFSGTIVIIVSVALSRKTRLYDRLSERGLVHFALPFLFIIPFVACKGSSDALSDLRTKEASNFIRELNQETKSIVPFKILDKGVIYKSLDDRSVHFSKWADISSFVRKEEEFDERTLLCKYLEVWCQSKKKS